MRPSRRRFLACGLGVAGTLLTGCGRGLGTKTTLRYWNGFTGPDGRTMLRLVQRFNAANPDVQVIMQRMDWATYYNKLFVAGLGGRAPEIFVLQTHSVARFAKANFVRSIDDLTARVGTLDVNDLDANVWEAVSANGKHYGIPLDIWPLGMYYNKKLFREAGVVDKQGEPKPPTNRDEFFGSDAQTDPRRTMGLCVHKLRIQRLYLYAAVRRRVLHARQSKVHS